MNKVDSREFNQYDYMACQGVVDDDRCTPRISEFEEGYIGINVVIAKTMDDSYAVDTTVFQGDGSETMYHKSFDDLGEAEQFYEKLLEALESEDYAEIQIMLSNIQFDCVF